MKIKNIREFTDPLLQDLFATLMPLDWKNPKMYGDFLAQTHFHICHTTRLLAAGGARFGIEQDQFHIQCMKHAGEERSHEKLSISDLKEIGLKLEQFSELPATKALYRNAYYLIEHMSPITLFGYAYFLERVGAEGVRLEKQLVEAHGKKAVKHLSLHAHEDPGHIRQYEEMLNEFSAENRRFLEEGIVSTANHYRTIYVEINARCSKSSTSTNKKAA